MDIKVNTSTRDIVIENGRPVLVSGTDAIIQRLRLRLLTFQGEWYLNLTFGVAWFAKILGHRFSAGQIQTTLYDPIIKTPGITQVNDLTAIKSPTDPRTTIVTVTASTADGQQPSFEVTVP
jgi:hypothetical protein